MKGRCSWSARSTTPTGRSWGNALHTTRATARLITNDLHGHYILIIKGNQPIARATAQALLAGPDTDWEATTTSQDDRGHGRVERRTIRVAPADDTLFPVAARAEPAGQTPSYQPTGIPARSIFPT